MSSRLPTVVGSAGAIAVALGIGLPAASGGSLPSNDEEARYAPIQSISYVFGSKSMSGYFVQQAGTCLVTLMITEQSDPDQPLALSPTRVRLLLQPGQIAGLDSEEGRSLNVTCGGQAAMVIVNVGDRDQLIAQQIAALKQPPEESQGMAKAPQALHSIGGKLAHGAALRRCSPGEEPWRCPSGVALSLPAGAGLSAGADKFYRIVDGKVDAHTRATGIAATMPAAATVTGKTAWARPLLHPSSAPCPASNHSDSSCATAKAMVWRS